MRSGRNRASIWLSDFARAIHELQPSPEALPVIAAMLQVGVEGQIASVVTPATQQRSTETVHLAPVSGDNTVSSMTAPATATTPSTHETPPDLSQITKRETERILPISVESVATARDELAASLAPPPMAAATDEEHEPEPDLIPLMDPLTLRSTLASAVATIADDGAIDVDGLTRALTREDRIDRLPRLRVPTMRRGAQVLIDRGSRMAPFARDADHLARALVSIIGTDAAQILRFRGLPSWDVYDVGRRARLQYEFPPPGVPVVLITEFAITLEPFMDDFATTSQWTRFLASLRQRGNAVVAFVPYSHERWPKEIAAVAALVTWDRSTNATAIRAAKRRLGR
jgi:hypothetical protein